MSDDVSYEPGFSQQQPGDDRLRETVAELTEIVRESARRTAALDARIDSLPGPMEIANAVESEVERSVRDARDVIDARVGSISGELESLSRRLAEVSEALVPLEGLRTEIATVADESAAFHDIRTKLQGALEQLSGGQLPTVAGDTIGAEVDARLDQFRRVLEETATTIRSDFELLVGGERDASERRSDALGLRITNMSVGVTATLEQLTGQAERMAQRAREIESENAAILQSIRQEIASASGAPRVETKDETGPRVLAALQDLTDRMSAIESRLAQRVESKDETSPLVLDQLHEITTKIGAMESRITEGLSSMEPRAVPSETGLADELRGQLAAELAGVQPAIEEMRARVSELARIEPTLDDVGAQLATLAHGDPSLADVRAGLAELARFEPALSDIRAQLREVARLQPTQADSEASRAVMSSTVEQLRATLDASVVAMEQTLAQSINEIQARLDAVEASVARAVVDTSDALDGAAAQTAGGMQDIRTALAQLEDSGAGIERIRQELFQAIESFGTQLVTRTAGVKTSITERAGRLEDQIAALPGRDDVADAVVQRLTATIAEHDQVSDEKMAGMEQELGGVASNVNEIWIRVRAIVKGLEEEREAAHEDAARTAARVEELARGEDRLAVRLIEAEQRLVESMRAIETQRDRVFLETLRDLLDKMPRRERKVFRKRVRGIAFRRGEPDTSPPPVPEAAAQPQRRFAPQAPAETTTRAEPARVPQAPLAKAKPKPSAKAKPKPKPAASSPPKPTPAPKPKPAAKAKPKPKPKIAATAPKPAAKPRPSERPPEQPSSTVEQTEPTAAADTHPSNAPPAKSYEAPKEGPSADAAAEGSEGRSGADQGV